ncbi:MAG: GntR family transcriptional regulator [Clostridia bacterium]|nr:GntR family transcriptional regulator [Clostridia bacterium]
MFQIDPMSRTPIYEQLIEQTEKFILTGAISAGDQIPSVRSVSVELSVNPVTILKAYSDLSSRGIIKSVPGRGYFVCSDAKEKLSAGKSELLFEVSTLASELALAGIPMEAVIKKIEEAYGNFERKDDDK